MKPNFFICVALWLIPCIITTSTGCNSSNTTSPQSQGSAQEEFFGKTLSVHSSPTSVAEVALLAIQKNDLETLASLVAADRVKKDLASITKGKSQFSKWTESGPETSAKAIAISIQSLVAPVSLGAETIHGDQATVVVSGAGADRLRERSFYLCREQGWWKLVPSHR